MYGLQFTLTKQHCATLRLNDSYITHCWCYNYGGYI